MLADNIKWNHTNGQATRARPLRGNKLVVEYWWPGKGFSMDPVPQDHLRTYCVQRYKSDPTAAVVLRGDGTWQAHFGAWRPTSA